jgi:hypothetical protein
MKLPLIIAAPLSCLALSAALRAEPAPAVPAVTFDYAFDTPHRVTVALPDSSNKTLVDCAPGQVTLSWTYENLLNYPLATFATPRTAWHVVLRPEVDGKKFPRSSWHRAEGWLPALEDTFESPGVTGRMVVVGGARAGLVRMEFTSTDPARAHRVGIDCTTPGHWLGVNPAFVDPTDPLRPRDVLLAGWMDRADRVIIAGVGAEEYAGGDNTLYPAVTLRPGETKVVWLVRPYLAYQSMLPELRRRDWSGEFEQGLKAWRSLIGQASRLALPDPGVRNAYYSGLADVFIMREPVARGYIGTTPGTEMYRNANPIEAAIGAIDLVQAGMSAEAVTGYRLSLDSQAFDGCWSDPEGWDHDCWFSSGFKSWFVMEHYLDTRDRGFLATVFPHMMASTRWQGRERARTRVLVNGRRTLDYGLLPPGMGDAGLMNGTSFYGVFLPHNIWALYGDRLTVRAAEFLGLAREAAEAREIYEEGRVDLLAAIRGGAIQEQGYRWIPGVAGKTTGSRWGALNAAFPCGLLAPDDELITGTIRKMESRMSPGGIPMHTGWMEDGMWVAITVDNLAETLLLRGDGDGFSRYLYATLNHATPLYSWCEERGPEKGARKTSGDRQHLWTPVAVVRAIRDSLVFEDAETLHLARGADRSWLTRGPVGGDGLQTHFGPVSYRLAYDAPGRRVTGSVALAGGPPPAVLAVHVRLPAGLALKAVSDPSARIVDGGSTLEWTTPPRNLSFWADVGK